MKKDQILTAFSLIGKRTKIKPLDMNGKIIGVYFNEALIDYHVQYYWNGDQRKLYFRIDELEVIEESNENMGFKNEK